MIIHLVISVVVSALSGVLTSLFYQRHLHGRDTSPDFGPRLRRLVQVWEEEAASHRRLMTERAGDDAAFAGHQEAWATYIVCAGALASLLNEASDVQARSAEEERNLSEPVSRIGDDPRARNEYLARRLDGHLSALGRRGYFPEEGKTRR